MCGRYSLLCTDDLGNRFRIYEPLLGFRSHFNVAPSQTMPVVVQREHTEMVMMQWGLLPHWKKDLKGPPLFAFAGLFDIWHDAEGGVYPTYTIITTGANELVAPIHDRMPVILRQEDEVRWLSSAPPDPDEMKTLLGSYPAGEMETYPVSSRVNSPAVDDKALLVPLS